MHFEDDSSELAELT